MARNPMIRLTCLECGDKFDTRRTDQYFCGKSCKKTWNNRAASRGAQMYHHAMQWRTERGESGKVGMTELCHVISGFIAEDKAAAKKRYSVRKQ